MTWKTLNDGPIWVPVCNFIEIADDIPTDLLARMAFEESSFLPEVISGEVKSTAGCIGIMQLNPRYFPDAGQDPHADIASAGEFLRSLYARFGDWQVAVAAYNWGEGNMHHEYMLEADRYELTDMPEETQNYVRQIFTDVPVTGALIP